VAEKMTATSCRYRATDLNAEVVRCQQKTGSNKR